MAPFCLRSTCSTSSGLDMRTEASWVPGKAPLRIRKAAPAPPSRPPFALQIPIPFTDMRAALRQSEAFLALAQRGRALGHALLQGLVQFFSAASACLRSVMSRSISRMSGEPSTSVKGKSYAAIRFRPVRRVRNGAAPGLEHPVGFAKLARSGAFRSSIHNSAAIRLANFSRKLRLAKAT